MHRLIREGELYLNGVAVGTVSSEGITDSWAYGKFEPGNRFEDFAAFFGAWSLLIHEDNEAHVTPREALEELAIAEAAIDSIRAELRWSDAKEPTRIVQLNIDGPLIEWKTL
jgi:hypothetical protein